MKRHSHRVDVPVIPTGQPEDAKPKTKAYGAYARQYPSPRPRQRRRERWFGRMSSAGATPFRSLRTTTTSIPNVASVTAEVERLYYVRIAADDTVWLDFSDGTTRQPKSDLQAHEVIMRSRSGSWLELKARPAGYGVETAASAAGDGEVEP